MHSYRLRYVALGLLVYIQGAFSELAPCTLPASVPAGFEDVPSLSALAGVVFEGRPVAVVSTPDVAAGRFEVWIKIVRRVCLTL